MQHVKINFLRKGKFAMLKKFIFSFIVSIICTIITTIMSIIVNKTQDSEDENYANKVCLRIKGGLLLVIWDFIAIMAITVFIDIYSQYMLMNALRLILASLFAECIMIGSTNQNNTQDIFVYNGIKLITVPFIQIIAYVARF